jgi:hypothetical protein
MKPALLMSLGLLALAGCVTAPTAVVPVTPMKTVAAPAPRVRPEQVTPENARKLSDALATELDREAQHDISSSAKQ